LLPTGRSTTVFCVNHQSPSSPRSADSSFRSFWEVYAALLLMTAVVAVLDVGWIHRPDLLLSLAPLACLMLASARRVDVVFAILWAVVFGVVGVLVWDWRYAMLAWPAPLVCLFQAVLFLVKRPR
jgi:hypothetical protein